jgi:glycosyltransferase involved in cell wall biosynthesis
VTVLTSRYAVHLPQYETLVDVRVVRVNVGLRLGKGPLMPALPWIGWKLARQADIIHLHLPQFDAALLAIFGRLLHKPVILTYHCDLSLPPGWLNKMAGTGSAIASQISASLAQKIITNTTDYAAHSPILRRHLHKLTPVLPPIEIPNESNGAAPGSGADNPYAHLQGPVIGMVGRLAAEKGAEILASAMPIVRERYPTATVLHAGEHEQVPGEEEYIRKIKTQVAALNENQSSPAWHFLGRLSDADLVNLFDACSLTVLPSLNSTESFGMVQVESMARGKPVVASNLPGVREPVHMTNMGEIIPHTSSIELAQAILKILDHPESYQSAKIRAKRDGMIHAMRPENVAMAYENIFQTL